MTCFSAVGSEMTPETITKGEQKLNRKQEFFNCCTYKMCMLETTGVGE